MWLCRCVSLPRGHSLPRGLRDLGERPGSGSRAVAQLQVPERGAERGDRPGLPAHGSAPKSHFPSATCGAHWDVPGQEGPLLRALLSEVGLDLGKGKPEVWEVQPDRTLLCREGSLVCRAQQQRC